MPVATTDSWKSCRAKLSEGRAPCSSIVVDNKDRLLVVGGGSSGGGGHCGEIIEWSSIGGGPQRCGGGNISVPGVRGYSSTSACGSIVFIRDTQRLYQVLRNKRFGHDDLFVANIDHIMNRQRNWWSWIVQWLFQNVWTPSVPMETRDAALAGDGVRYIYAVGGFVPWYRSGYPGYQTGRFQSAMNKIFHRERVSRSVRKFDTRRLPSWMEVPDLPQGRRDAAAVVCNNYLYVIGGRGHDGKTISSMVRLDLSSQSPSCRPSSSSSSSSLCSLWEEMAPLEKGPRCSMAAVAFDDRYIVVAGGCVSQLKRLKTVECYDCATNQWFSLPDMLDARANCSLSHRKSSNTLVVAGGTTGWLGGIPSRTLETLQVWPLEEGEEETVNASRREEESIPTRMDIGVCGGGHWRWWRHRFGHGTRTATHAIVLGEDHMGTFRPLPSAPMEAGLEEDNMGDFRPLPSAPTEAKIEGRSPVSPTTSVCVPVFPLPAAGVPESSSSLDRSCAVCLERPKSVAFLCGHQVCMECSPLLDNCHICRKPIEGRIRLFD